MSSDDRFDMVVIGSGPAGEKAAAQGAYFGNRVAIVERSPSPGGAAVSTAGIPTKTLRETALYVTGFGRREVYGVSLTLDPDATVAQLRGRTDQVVRTMTEAVRRNIERHGIQFVRGAARLGADRTVHVTGDAGEERLLQGNVVLIATGSRPFHPRASHSTTRTCTTRRPSLGSTACSAAWWSWAAGRWGVSTPRSSPRSAFG